MKKLSAISLVLVGVALGCGVAATTPVSFAAPGAGKWACYRHTDMPDGTEVRSKRSAAHVATALNTVAAHVPAGTVSNINSDTISSMFCVKH